MPPQKIAFIRMGSYSHINAPLMDALARAYPDFQVVPIDLERDLVRKKSLPALAWALLEYGPDLVSGKKEWREELHAREMLTRTQDVDGWGAGNLRESLPGGEVSI